MWVELGEKRPPVDRCGGESEKLEENNDNSLA